MLEIVSKNLRKNLQYSESFFFNNKFITGDKFKWACFLRRDDTHDSNKLDPGWITTTGLLL